MTIALADSAEISNFLICQVPAMGAEIIAAGVRGSIETSICSNGVLSPVPQALR